MEILAAAAFAVRSTHHRNNKKTPGQLLFGRYMILPINHLGSWILIRQCKQAQIEKDIIRKFFIRVDHEYSIGD